MALPDMITEIRLFDEDFDGTRALVEQFKPKPKTVGATEIPILDAGSFSDKQLISFLKNGEINSEL